MLKKLQNKKGFTLMEMLIVVAIIAVLVAIAIPVFNGALTKSKEAADVANVRATYAEWQTAMLTENTKAPADKDAFLKGPDNGTAIVLNYGDDKLAYDAGTGTITYSAKKLTDENGAKTFPGRWVRPTSTDIHLSHSHATAPAPARPGRCGATRLSSGGDGRGLASLPAP